MLSNNPMHEATPPTRPDQDMSTPAVGRLGLSDEEENALVSFMQTLTDGFMQR
jgi:hypothetical protein